MVLTVINQGSGRDDDDGDTGTGSRQQTAMAKPSAGFWNLDLELQAIKTILTPSSEWATKVYAVCKTEFFHHQTTQALFVRLQELMGSSGSMELPTLDFVLSDSKISTGLRQTVRAAFEAGDAPIAIAKSQGDYDLLIQGLSSLAKTRALYQATHKAAAELLDSGTPTDLVKQVTNRLGESLFRLEDDEDFLAQVTMGKGYNQAAEDTFNRIASGSFDGVRIRTGFEEFDRRTGGFHRSNLVIVGADSGGGKCQWYEGLIPTSKGTLQIGDIYNRFAPSGVQGWVVIPSDALHVYTREGIKEVNGVFKTEGKIYVVETDFGDEFGGLGEHKLYCYDNAAQTFGFKRLDEIQKDRDWVLKAVETKLYGKNLAIPYTPPELLPNARRQEVARYPEVVTVDLATIFGLIVAEGYKAVSFINSDPEILDYMLLKLKDLFGCDRSIIKDGRTINFGQVLMHYFSFFLGDVKSAERYVPKCVMEAPEDIQCAFLRGLYEGDGCIYEVNKGGKKGKESHVWSLELTSISKQLICDVKALLENIGIYCRLECKDTWAANGSANQVAKPGYHLFVLRESYELFQQRIGFMSERKSGELARCVAHCAKMTEAGNSNYFVSGLYNRIPKAPVVAYIQRVFELLEGQTITIKGLAWDTQTSYERPVGKYHVFYPSSFVTKILKNEKSYTSKYTANLVITSHYRCSTRNKITGEDVPVAPHIRELIENDLVLKELRSHIQELCSQVWAQVASVEYREEVVPVFDLSVPGPHEYAASGLLSHNSLFAVNLLRRQFALGYNTILVSYEMTEEEVLIRLISNISEVGMSEIQNNKTTPPQIDQINAAWREFNLLGYEKGNYYTIICPRKETTVPEVGFRVRTMKPDVLILDYINLLSASTGAEDAQWQKLGEISREAKLLANKLNCVVILLAQIDDTYNLRYSKAIKDHANFVMGWIRDEEARNSKIIRVNQMKARNSERYNFELVERFDIAQFRDPEQLDRTEWPTRDELMMLELKCQSLGLKLEPTASKEFDRKRAEEARRVVNSIDVQFLPEPQEQKKEEPVVSVVERAVQKDSLLFSAEDAIPVDFSKLEVKASSVSLLNNDVLYEDTV